MDGTARQMTEAEQMVHTSNVLAMQQNDGMNTDEENLRMQLDELRTTHDQMHEQRVHMLTNMDRAIETCALRIQSRESALQHFVNARPKVAENMTMPSPPSIR